jgi:mannose-1-phosphate guanylyltransferase
MKSNSSVNVNTAAGVVVASEEIDSKKHQVIIHAGPSGHLVDSLPTYLAWANDVAFAANKHHISIMNASGSGKIIRIQNCLP